MGMRVDLKQHIQNCNELIDNQLASVVKEYPKFEDEIEGLRNSEWEEVVDVCYEGEYIVLTVYDSFTESEHECSLWVKDDGCGE